MRGNKPPLEVASSANSTLILNDWARADSCDSAPAGSSLSDRHPILATLQAHRTVSAIVPAVPLAPLALPVTVMV